MCHCLYLLNNKCRNLPLGPLVVSQPTRALWTLWKLWNDSFNCDNSWVFPKFLLIGKRSLGYLVLLQLCSWKPPLSQLWCRLRNCAIRIANNILASSYLDSIVVMLPLKMTDIWILFKWHNRVSYLFPILEMEIQIWKNVDEIFSNVQVSSRVT